MRPLIPVACGVLVDERGEVLIAQRPAGKIAAGKWEFPGGKIEPGESARTALERELDEELGICIQSARPLIRIRHDYSDRTVILDTWRIESWRGVAQSREGQGLAWCRPDRLHDYDLLAADGPIVDALCLPLHYVFTPPLLAPTELLARMSALPRGALLRLRLPQLDDLAYESLARQAIAEAARLGLQVILDRDPAQVAALGAAGWHGSAARLQAMRARPLGDGYWVAGSAHDAAQLRHLHSIGADFAVLGPVQATATHPLQTPLGWDGFQSLTLDCGLPVYAIGGVGPPYCTQAHAHYAQGVAGISAYWSGSSPAGSTASGDEPLSAGTR